jgi:hypothetical protein
MDSNQALSVLGIEKYKERIINSNSHGELFHLYDYIILAKNIGRTTWFPIWFDGIINEAEKSWERPESVFQHIGKIFLSQF